MSYNLQLTAEAEETLFGLIEERLPENVHNDAIDSIDEQLVEFADNPIQRHTTGPHGLPMALLEVQAGGRVYYWGMSFYFAEDERTIVVTLFTPLQFLL